MSYLNTAESQAHKAAWEAVRKIIILLRPLSVADQGKIWQAIGELQEAGPDLEWFRGLIRHGR